MPIIFRAGGLLLVGAACLGVCSWGQTADEFKRSLETELKGKQVPIRDFLATPVMTYRWQGDHFEQGPERVFEVGVFRLGSVKVHASHDKPDHVALLGKRNVLLRGAGGILETSPVIEEVRFEVDLRDAPVDAVRGLAARLFFPDSATMLGAIPRHLACPIPGWAGASIPCGKIRPGQWIEEEGMWRQLGGSEKVTPPQVLRSLEPEFPVEARNQKVSGSVSLLIAVGTDGKPEEIWVLRPMEYGLSAKAVQAASGYRFRPAEYQGRPVGSTVTVEIHFQIL